MAEHTSNVRPPPSSTCQMRFWEWTFPSAMSDFQSRYPREPKGRADSGYSIRLLSTWDEVYNTLHNAKEKYERQSGLRGGLRRGLRRVALHSEPMAQVSKLVPNIDYASPIVGALEIISSVCMPMPFRSIDRYWLTKNRLQRSRSKFEMKYQLTWMILKAISETSTHIWPHFPMTKVS